MLTTLLQLNLPEVPVKVKAADFARYVLPKRKEETSSSNVSPFIESQLPEFVLTDHPIFLSFIESYYEWLQLKDNAYNMTTRLRSLYDIDNTIDQYNAKPKNKDNKISAKGEQGAKEMFNRVYLKGFSAIQVSTLNSLGLTPELVEELMGPSGTSNPKTNNDPAGILN